MVLWMVIWRLLGVCTGGDFDVKLDDYLLVIWMVRWMVIWDGDWNADLGW